MKKIACLFLFFIICNVAFAQSTFNAKDLLNPPTGTQQLVNDYAGVLTSDQKRALESKLVQFDDSTSTQIVVVIVPNIGDYEIADYGVKLGRAWGVGGKEFSNGVVLLISKDDRKLNISTGYGVEGALPDVTCKHIIEELILPNFKGNDYYRGIEEGTDAIIRATKGEYKVDGKHSRKKQLGPLGKIILLIFIIFLIIGSIKGRRGGGGSLMSHGGAFLLGSALGGGGGGGSSSGGFGGFGGGSFGGGGSSGSW
jgi:uncharacterized protein